jgi:cytochrome bd ubiquinol oxidase subunit I
VLTSLTAFAVLYSSLLVITLFFASKIIRKGPNLELAAPFAITVGVSEAIAPVEHQLDSRPVN